MTYAEANTGAFSTGDFRIGRVISESLSIYFQNFISFTLIAAVLALPYIGMILLDAQWTPGQAPSARQVGLSLLSTFISFSLYGLTTAIILHATFQHMSGRPVRLGQSVGRGLARTLPLVVLTFLAGLGVGLGFLLLIVPGLYLATRWYVAVAACVVENLGPLRSMARSRDLTKGFRWKVFALMILFYILSIGGSQLMAFAGQATFDLGGQIIAVVVWQGLSGAFGAALLTVAYYYLRVAKEGIDVEQIAAVFD